MPTTGVDKRVTHKSGVTATFVSRALWWRRCSRSFSTTGCGSPVTGCMVTIQTLVDAARRGVKVRVIVPSGHIDSEVLRKASRGNWRQMLQAGIEIAEFQPTKYHVKGLVVDGVFSSVGSTNFDNRSFRLNDEANLNVLDRDFGAIQRGGVRPGLGPGSSHHAD